MKVNVDKTLVASIALHVLVIGWGLFTFSSRSMEAPPQESLPVDIISADQLSQMTQGIKSGEKDKPKPKVEKLAAAQPVDDAVGKITEKKETITTSATPPEPQKAVEKPVEKKPDPPKPPKPKPVVESKPKEPQKPQDKKPDLDKEDPMAEFIKKEAAKKPESKPETKPEVKPETKQTETKPKPETKPSQAQAKASPPKPKQERTVDYAQLATNALQLDKRDPTRQAFTGATLNASASLGTAHGRAATLSQSEMDALNARLRDLWLVPDVSSVERRKEMVVVVRFQLTRDRRLIGHPVVVERGNSPLAQVSAEAAVRAVIRGQPYNILRDETYENWKDIEVTFDPELKVRS